ncbi:MAG: ACP S-malonyltransferase [Bacteroidales bacterium]|nr:ACP S-malonyltransferase [Bacteroidales bacterium]
MKAYIFPGQGAQFVGMGNDLYEKFPLAKDLFEKANEILGFRITDVMFNGTEDDLKQTKVTQPAIFIHSVILSQVLKDKFNPDMVAGHSLGEFSALVANKSLSFKDGLRLVSKRAYAMQKACENQPSTMAAIVGLQDDIVEGICDSIDDIVVVANYNTKGQIVISGSVKGVETAIPELKKAGAKLAIPLKVGGAFHSPLMEPARVELAKAIESTPFKEPICSIYQNVTGQPVANPDIIKSNLIAQLTSPVRWTETMNNMIGDGAEVFVEVGPGNVLQGLMKRFNRNIKSYSATEDLI